MATLDVQLKEPMHAPVEKVGTILDDLTRLPEWLTFAEKVLELSSPEAGKGVRYTVKPPGTGPKSVWEIVEFEPGRRQVHIGTIPMLRDVRSTIEIEPGEGRVRWQARPTAVGRLLLPVMRRRIQTGWAESLRNLDALAARS